MQWKSFLREYLSFSRKERYGVICLCSLILLVFIARLLMPRFIKGNPYEDITVYNEQITYFLQKLDSVKRYGDIQSITETQTRREYFYFDPNTVTDDVWKQLGMNGKQIQNIRNYQAKGGHFYKKSDLKKLYTIPVTLYNDLEPYITIAKNQSEVIEPDKSKNERIIPDKQPFVLELNSADSAALVRLSGVGPVFATRIIKYRELLGGFVNINQLCEVYGVKQELVERLTSQLAVNADKLNKINLNTAQFQDLVKHPYLNAQQVRGILKYRELEGNIKNMDDLEHNHILTREDIEKINPYIILE